MKLKTIHLLDIKDPSGGDQLIAEFDKDKVLQLAQDWLRGRQRFADPANEANLNETMDSLMEGRLASFIGGSSIQIRESKLDTSGVVEVLQDAQHTLGKLNKFVSRYKCGEVDRLKSSHLATEQAINLTIIKLGG